MNCNMVLCFFIAQFIETNPTTTTLSQIERIKRLREEIKGEINRNKAVVTDYDEDGDIFDHEKITPIINRDLKRYREKFKLRTSTVTVTNTSNIHRQGDETTKMKVKELKTKKPKLIFYRRMYNTEILDKPLKWVYCQDTITPFITGAKTKLSQPKLLTLNDSSVSRFLHLIAINTTTYNKDEIYSIMYQISTLHLKLFLWDLDAMEGLMRILMKGRPHDFRSLKYGVKRLFQTWRLDTSNVTVLLKQSRIFRPPCVHISTSDGSTKTAKVKKYTKPDKTTTPCPEDETDDF